MRKSAQGSHSGSAIGLLARSSLQFFRRHPAQLLLSVLGIVLGVGIVTAVLITNASASRAFALTTEALYGRSTHTIVAAEGITDARYAELRIARPDLDMAPIIEGYVGQGDRVLTLIGLDPLAESEFARFGASADSAQAASLSSALRLFEDPRAVIVAAPLAERLQLADGDTFTVDLPQGQLQLTQAGTFSSVNSAATDGLIVTDIARAQSWLARGATIDRVELVLDDDEASALSKSLPATEKLVSANTRRSTMQAMTRGFQINLTAMSLLALVVGGFLIHNSMSFAVLQRRELYAALRISGVTARQVLASILGEALAISVIASVLGVVLGRLIAEGLISMTTRTINDLYFVLHVQELVLGPGVVVLGLLAGIGTSLIAATASALDAASTSPVAARQRSLTEERTRTLTRPLAAAGVALMCSGGVLAWLPSLSLLVGFAALMLLIVGYGLTLPWLIHAVARASAPLARRGGSLSTLALGSIERDISRTGVAIAALAVAVSATFGVEVMIGSFRSSVDRWLGDTLSSDIYVSAPSIAGGGDALLNADITARVAQLPEVRAVSSGRELYVVTEIGPLDTLVLDPHDTSDQSFELLAGTPESAWQTWLHDGGLLISEPLATKHGLQAGDDLMLFTTAEGDRPFAIAGVFRDYASSHGKLMLARNTFDDYWQDNGISTLGILLNDPARFGDAATGVSSTLRESLNTLTDLPLQIRSGRAIHTESLAVFDQTFEVTRVLRWLTIGVAFVGIFSALLALHLERAREFAVLRASGGTQRQITTLVLLQSGLMGLLAGVLALPLGFVMSQLLIHVINLRSFGWRMQGVVPDGSVAAAIFLALVAALLAGLWPAWRVNRSNLARGLRED